MERNEKGYYLLPERPPGLPDEEDYPRRYTVNYFTPTEVNENIQYHSIRGWSARNMVKTDKIPYIVNGITETHSGYIPRFSNLNFRSMALGIIKINDEWVVVERTTGINLMPIKEPVQLSLIPTEKIKSGRTREQAMKIAEEHLKTFSDEQWIEIQKQVTYELSGIEFEYILTPEQIKLEAEWSEKFREVHQLNKWIEKKQNFIAHYKDLRIHKTNTKRMKMITKEKGVKVPEKLDPHHKTKFFCFQKDYGSNLEVEGIIMPIEIEGLTELKELIVVKGDQFKETPHQESYNLTQYIVCEPYTGSLMSFKSSKSLKETLEHITERLMILIEPKTIEKINKTIKLHNKKIKTVQNSGDITSFLLDQYSYNKELEQQAT